MYRRHSLPTILLPILLLLLSTNTALAQCVLQGTVVNSQGQALASANIFLPELGKGTATDKDGQFSIADLPSGNYRLEASYIGFATSETRINTASGDCTLTITLEEDPVFTGEIVVKATRANERTPVTYTILNRQALERNNLGQDLPYLLQATPSVVVTSDAGTGIGYTGIWIRGSDPTRINVTINGIPLNDAESQGVYWVNLPDFASSVEDVQIQRGVGTSTNGAGAFGATINLNTSKVNVQPYGHLDAGVGSFGTQKATLRFGTGLMKSGFALDGRVSRVHSDGYIDRASADLASWFIGATWLGKHRSLRINVFDGQELTYQAWNGVPAEYINDPVLRTFNSAGTERPGKPYDREVDDYGQTHVQVLSHNQLSANLIVDMALYYTKGAGYFEQYKAGQDLANYGIAYPAFGNDTVTHTDLIRRRWLDNDLFGFNYSIHYTSNCERLKATLGGGLNSYDGKHFGEVIWARVAGTSEIRDRYYDNDALKKDANTFLKLNYALTEKWDMYLDLQSRLVNYTFFGIDNQGNFRDQKDNLLFFNPKTGIQYRPNARERYYLGLAIANREPNRNDYIGSPAGRRPLPERLYNAELGWEHRRDNASVQAVVYYMYYTNQLVLNGQINDVGELLRTNVAQSYRAGLELNASYAPTTRWNLSGQLALSDNRIVEFTEFVDEYDADFNWLGQQFFKRSNTPLAFSPAVVAGAEAGYQLLQEKTGNPHRLHIALRARHIGSRYLDNSGDAGNTLPAYTFSDWVLQYSLKLRGGQRLRLNAQALNWLDAQYVANGWSYRYVADGQMGVQQGLYPQAGRHWLLGLGVDL